MFTIILLYTWNGWILLVPTCERWRCFQKVASRRYVRNTASHLWNRNWLPEINTLFKSNMQVFFFYCGRCQDFSCKEKKNKKAFISYWLVTTVTQESGRWNSLHRRTAFFYSSKIYYNGIRGKKMKKKIYKIFPNKAIQSTIRILDRSRNLSLRFI